MSAPHYDSNNIFAKILRGEIPCHRVLEDDHTLVFMDIMPKADGHVLIIPKQAARNLLDASASLLTPVLHMVQIIARASVRAFQADGVMLTQFSEAAAGQMVFHLHFHVIPRREGVELRPMGIRANNEILELHANKLKAALASV